MRKFTLLAALSLALTAGTADARKTYSGTEAAALRCAAILSVVPTAASKVGLISQKDVSLFHLMSGLILTKYVSGNERQKANAFKTVTQRYSSQEHVRDFQTKAKTCLRQFPI
ncbi:hypothetical protein E4Z66_11135 [Aliishimia ponticola]|uniref:Rap1a immunity protein domain-containing protein n=1 Tax=Aliishimia ponticola TaxID=2499833 RepID=A0A4V3XK52_9RHOB|nr:hypothetical protein [Aliishimia ponticola]THH35643.1 hypothetical protein E4Z66_11135 [Aliishimia ponticola]